MLSLSSRIFLTLSLSLFAMMFFCSCSNNQKTVTAAENLSQTVSIKNILQSQTAEHTAGEAPSQTAPQEQEYLFKSACFYRSETDELLFAYNEKEIIAPASLAKILTASVAFYYVDPETKFKVGTELDLVKAHSSLCLISKGQILTLQDLATGLLMASGNDASYTIAVNTARIVSDDENLSDSEAVSFFCNLMNSFAKAIGMKNSHFATPDGWDSDGQYTTVEDLLVLTQYALKIKPINVIISHKEKHVVFASGENITWKNSNQLLNPDSKHYNEYACGMKTGTTKKAGNCLVSVFRKNNKTYIGIVCGCETTDCRYEVTNRLFNFYETVFEG